MLSIELGIYALSIINTIHYSLLINQSWIINMLSYCCHGNWKYSILKPIYSINYYSIDQFY